MRVDHFNNGQKPFDDLFKMPNDKTFVLLVLYIIALFSIIKTKPMMLAVVAFAYIGYLMYYQYISDSTNEVDYEQLFKLSTLVVGVLFFATGLMRK